MRRYLHNPAVATLIRPLSFLNHFKSRARLLLPSMPQMRHRFREFGPVGRRWFISGKLSLLVHFLPAFVSIFSLTLCSIMQMWLSGADAVVREGLRGSVSRKVFVGRPRVVEAGSRAASRLMQWIASGYDTSLSAVHSFKSCSTCSAMRDLLPPIQRR
jgi:hypothetical protein